MLPAVRTIVSILKGAGLTQSVVVHAHAGRKETNLQGFRVQSSPFERRAVHVYHVGRGSRAGLTNYEAALNAAGYVVEKSFGGLKVTTRRSIADRSKDRTEIA